MEYMGSQISKAPGINPGASILVVQPIVKNFFLFFQDFIIADAFTAGERLSKTGVLL